ncbi:MAG: nuclear transport factor 2 family protein [Chlamydiota bacterium]
METNHAMLGEEYYKLVGEKNVEGIKKCLCPDVEFYSPMAILKGRDAVVLATSHFMNAIESLTIRAKFGSADQAMIVYDVDMPGIAKHFPGASLLSFRDGMIVRIELFYDSARAVEKKEEIFG